MVGHPVCIAFMTGEPEGVAPLAWSPTGDPWLRVLRGERRVVVAETSDVAVWSRASRARARGRVAMATTTATQPREGILPFLRENFFCKNSANLLCIPAMRHDASVRGTWGHIAFKGRLLVVSTLVGARWDKWEYALNGLEMSDVWFQPSRTAMVGHGASVCAAIGCTKPKRLPTYLVKLSSFFGMLAIKSILGDFGLAIWVKYGSNMGVVSQMWR